VVYTIEVSHTFDGVLTIDVSGVGHDQRSRSLAAETLLQAASLLDSDITRVEF